MKKKLINIQGPLEVNVMKIKDDPETKATLAYLGIAEGSKIKVLSKPTPDPFVPGPLEILVNDFKGVIGQGMAEMVVMEKEGNRIRLNELKRGEKGTIKEIQGGDDAKDFLWNLKIEIGTEIRLLRHLPDDILTFKVGDKEIEMGEGKASKVWVRLDNELIQLNYVRPNEVVKIARIDGGILTKKDFNELGVKEGEEIELLHVNDKSIRVANVDKEVFVEVEGHDIRLGHGLAEKIWVEEK